MDDDPVPPPGVHPDGLLGGLNFAPLQPMEVQAQEILPPVLKPADGSFRIPPLPPDALAGMFAPSEMTASPRLLDFLKSYERGPDGGPALRPYPSPEGGRDTVGWGHKLRRGEDYSRGLTATQADQLFLRDLGPHQRLVQEQVKAPLTQQQFDALVSLAYNLPGAFDPENSKLLNDLNSGDYLGAANQLPRWNYAGGVVMRGLTERRANERAMFLNGVYTDHK